MLANARLGVEDVTALLRDIGFDEGAVLVGGQAVCLWEEFYARVKPEAFASGRVVTSKDIDYVGGIGAARQFAAKTDGEIQLPDKDHLNTPNSAIVLTSINNKRVQVDFLSGILGVAPHELRRGATIMGIKFPLDGEQHYVEVRVLHPALSFKSRVANVLHPATSRRDAFAFDQYASAYKVLQCHIERSIGLLETGEVHYCCRTLSRFLCSDEHGRRAHEFFILDPLDILKPLVWDGRLDVRYRELTLSPTVSRVEATRTAAQMRRAVARS